MSNKTISKKIKIIQFKDIVSILLIVIILVSLTITFATTTPIIYVNKNNKKITTRNLAMFASIVYANLEELEKYNITMDTNVNKLTFKSTPMVTDKQLSSLYTKTTLTTINVPLSNEKENTYNFLFYGLASTEEVADWKIVNYIKLETSNLKVTADFTAMTFQRDNDIVIAYRGTDAHDLNEWGQDLLYGLIEYAGQEEVAQKYAKSVAKKYINHNIYVTGHSLGGYLAQIGGSALVGDNNYKKSVKEITYFNGIGLKFWSNILPKMPKKLQNTIDNIDDFLKANSILNKTQDKAQKALTNWKNSGGKIESHYINGDIVSALGTHVGTTKSYDAHPLCIKHHNGNQSSVVLNNVLAKTVSIINPFLNNPIDSYITQYKVTNLLDFIWITHTTDSFFGVLPYEDNSLPSNITVKIKTPSTLKCNVASSATLTITTIGGELETTTLKVSHFKLSNITSLKITSISKPKIKSTNDGKIYTYTINLKGGKLIGISTITLKPNILKLKVTNTSCTNTFQNTSNNILISNSIKTKLF